jgi:hypothetical protein
MMASALAVDALVPFVWRPEPTALNWLPFALSGQGQSEFYSAAQLLREMAWSGALLWLCLHAGLSWRTSFIGCFAGLTLGELVQIFLVSGWPDITDVVVLCTIALMMRGLEQVLAANAKETCPRVC